jgi:hypothetical protein
MKSSSGIFRMYIRARYTINPAKMQAERFTKIILNFSLNQQIFLKEFKKIYS